MPYISPNNEYPRYLGDIFLDNPGYLERYEAFMESPDYVPGTDFDEPLPEGWVEVNETPYPTHGPDEIAYEDLPVEVDGVMTQNWKVRALTSEEIEAKNAPQTAKDKLIALGLTDAEVHALLTGLVR